MDGSDEEAKRPRAIIDRPRYKLAQADKNARWRKLLDRQPIKRK